MNKILFTVDVEKDLHSNLDKGIFLGLKRFEKLCDKYAIKPVLFVTSECIEDNPDIFRYFNEKGWEISSHGFSHKRFDEMDKEEKEKEIKNTLNIFKKYLKIKPKGFRAPQHSIDDETLKLLEKYGFQYDSSYIPFNFLQLLFFPKKFKLWIKTCFSKTSSYKIMGNLEEKPIPSLIIPPVSILVRVLPKPFLWIYFKILCNIYKKPIFYAHSWDFIELPKSKIDKLFSHRKFIKKLDFVIKYFGVEKNENT